MSENEFREEINDLLDVYEAAPPHTGERYVAFMLALSEEAAARAKTHETLLVLDCIADRGWRCEGTGGNCTAFSKRTADGREILITQSAESLAPVNFSDPVDLTAEDTTGDINYHPNMDLRAALDLADQLASPTE